MMVVLYAPIAYPERTPRKMGLPRHGATDVLFGGVRAPSTAPASGTLHLEEEIPARHRTAHRPKFTAIAAIAHTWTGLTAIR
jgi:hypothetical protein